VSIGALAVLTGATARRICVASFTSGVPVGLAVALRDGSIKCALVFYGAPEPALLQPGSPPIFAAKAGRDSEEINDAFDALHRRAQAIGADVQVVTHESACTASTCGITMLGRARSSDRRWRSCVPASKT
jgi:dienelactone hydrolase